MQIILEYLSFPYAAADNLTGNAVLINYKLLCNIGKLYL